MARGLACEAHSHRSLVPLESHHVWPLGYHGPDVRTNRVLICANAHGDAHYLLEAMLKGKPYDLRTYGLAVRVIARRGYEQVIAYGEALASQQKP